MIKKLTTLTALCLACIPFAVWAQSAADSKTEAAIIKVSKEDLKDKVRTSSNGNVVVGKIKLNLNHYPNLPSFFDSYLLHFFPSLDVKALDEAVGLWKTKNAEKNPDIQDMFGAINSALIKQKVRIKPLGAAENNVRQRINSGIPVYWAASVDYAFIAFLHDRNIQRAKFRDLSQWKKTLLQNQYKADPKDNRRTPLYFFITGYNSKSGEIAISASPEADIIFWITPGELRKYSHMLWEPTL